MKEKNQFRQTKQWKEFRQSLLVDWNGKCGCCGCKTKRPQLHHIDPSNYQLLEPSLFVFVCSGCHKQISKLERIKKENWSNYDPLWVECYSRFVG